MVSYVKKFDNVKRYLCKNWISLTLFVLWITPSTGKLTDYCINEGFRAECLENEVIVITEAIYGRMSTGTCVTNNYGYIGCKMDVRTALNAECGGRNQCTVDNFERSFSFQNQCPPDLTKYLQASYKCMKVDTDNENTCKRRGYVHKTRSHGHIASVFAQDLTDQSGLRCPWLIEGKPGQTVNVTLHDYTLFDIQNGEEESWRKGPYCLEYAEITENNSLKNIVQCSDTEKVKVVYSSNSHKIGISIKPQRDSPVPSHFVLEYKVIGCPYPIIPQNAYLVPQSGHNVLVKCNDTREEWSLKCENNVWVGALGNCTTGALVTDAQEPVFSLGVSILIIMAVAILVCLVCLALGMIYLNRRKRREQYRDHYPIETYVPTTPDSRDAKLVALTMQRTPTLDRSYAAMTRTIRSNNGEYAHIWELRQPQQQINAPVHCHMQSQCTCGYTASVSTAEDANSEGTTDTTLTRTFSTFKPNIDHIYESPKFEKRPPGRAISLVQRMESNDSKIEKVQNEENMNKYHISPDNSC